MKKRALLVGIDGYEMLGPLRYARADAEAVAEALIRYCGFRERDITVMTCASPGAQRALSGYVEDALDILAEEEGLDLAVFGFWGHGYRPDAKTHYLCGLEAKPSRMERSSLHLDVIRGKLSQAKARDTLLLLDCCQTRPAQRGRRGSGDALPSGSQAAFRDLACTLTADGLSTVAILNACSDGQVALEWEDRKHGIFTAHLLEAFAQGSRRVGELGYYVTEHVPLTARKLFHEDQRPFITIEGRGDIVLGQPGASVQATTATPPPPRVGRVEIVTPRLHVSTTPPGAQISVEGREVGASPVSLALGPGQYRVSAELPGHQPWRNRISFDGLGDAELPIALTKAPSGPKPGEGKTVDLGGGESMDLVWIPPGDFMMGSPDSDDMALGAEKPQHRVEITRGFWMGKYPVTQAQWEAVMGKNPSYIKGPDRPVENVSWNDCQGFLEKLNTLGGTFSLPTEAQWEYACRAGSTTRYYFGDNASDLGHYAWYRENSGSETHPVGRKQPNAWGLYDMHGNVWEWCRDWYHAGFYGRSPKRDPENNTKSDSRVLRGGRYGRSARRCRVANRLGFSPGSTAYYGGFRVVRTP